MKQLILVRHGKSSWADEQLRDIERPLNKRGLRNAPEMGRRLRAAGVSVERIYSSPAVRAFHTAELVAEELGFATGDIETLPSLYTFNYEELLSVVRSLDDACNPVMMVCHNPAITDLVNFLALSHLGNIPTAGVATLSLQHNSWADSCAGSAELVEFDYPKKES
ncbi:MAG: histidine phosphatase family protein [Porticoccaceae bacterium]|nr:histidine phosphatase family protein [Porticoccaceae bacterium]